MKLTKRLEKIASFVQQGSIIADLGTDHGYIPIYLALNNIISKAYAVDIGEGPLERAKKNIEENNVKDKVEAVLSDGLEKITDKHIDTLIIAGMGGMLIKKILFDASLKLKEIPNLILSPHLDVKEVRHTVHKLGYSIIKEDLILEDNKLYSIIVCHHGNEYYKNDYEYKYGKLLIETKNKLLKKYILERKKKYNDILLSLSNENTQASLKRKKEIKYLLNEIEEVIMCLS